MNLKFKSGLEIETDHPNFIIQNNNWIIIKDLKCRPDYSKLNTPLILKVGKKAIKIIP